MASGDLVRKNLEGLPPREQVRICSEAFRANPAAQEARRKAWEESFGCLNEETGQAMEEALWAGRHLLPETEVDVSDPDR